MTQVPPPAPTTPQPVIPVCYRHPKREAHVRCARCDRPICPDCMTEASVGHQCPECIQQGRKTQRQGRTVFGGSTAGQYGFVTIGLIVTNVVVAIFSAISAGGKGQVGGALGGLFGGDTPLVEKGAVVGKALYTSSTGQHFIGPAGIADGEYYRLVTSMFLHLGPLHLIVNMYALWIIGRVVEAALGPVRFFLLYMAAGIGGSVAVYVFAPSAGAVGASGAIFGLFAALFVIFKRLRRDTSAIIPLLIINVLISFIPGISLAGHIGGLVTGGLLAFAFAYAPPKRRDLLGAAAVLGVAALFWVAIVLQTNNILAQGFVPTR